MAKFVPVKLAYKVYKPEGDVNDSLSPIIFLHGVTGQKENWNDIPQIIANRSKRTAYAVDARNHGETEHTDIFNFDVNADDLIHFMDSIHVPKAVIVGHSMGGVTAIKTALKKPERVEMIFSEDMFTKKCTKELMDAVVGFVQFWIKSLQSVPKEMTEKEAHIHCLDYMFSKIPPNANFFDKEKLYDMRMTFNRTADGGFDVKYNKEAVLSALRNTETLMSEPEGQYDGPAYFIYGSVSPFYVGKEEESIKKHFPRAELIEFANATHNVHMEYPEKFVETVIQRLHTF